MPTPKTMIALIAWRAAVAVVFATRKTLAPTMTRIDPATTRERPSTVRATHRAALLTAADDGEPDVLGASRGRWRRRPGGGDPTATRAPIPAMISGPMTQLGKPTLELAREAAGSG